MKIHSRRIKEDFASFFADLERSVQASLKKHGETETPNIFKAAYPLFVMLETLSNLEYFSDPSMQIELDKCIELGDKNKIIAARRKLFSSTMKMSEEMKRGLEEELFTPYFKELYSDTFLLVDQYYLNNYRGCYLYLRCILEDMYKHIYYRDHRQEFYMVTSEGMSEYTLGITPQFLRSYLEKTLQLHHLKAFNYALEKLDDANREQDKETIFKLNDNLYSKTSAFVHPSTETFMGHITSNSELVYEEKKAQEVLDSTKEVINITIILLICVHFQQFCRFNEYEKSLIIAGFEEKTKRNLRINFGI
jgi:hypothetical protein